MWKGGVNMQYEFELIGNWRWLTCQKYRDLGGSARYRECPSGIQPYRMSEPGYGIFVSLEYASLDSVAFYLSTRSGVLNSTQFSSLLFGPLTSRRSKISPITLLRPFYGTTTGQQLRTILSEDQTTVRGKIGVICQYIQSPLLSSPGSGVCSTAYSLLD